MSSSSRVVGRSKALQYANGPFVTAACFAIFLLAHGLNLIPAGNNVDDWGHASAGSDWGVLGRWGLELFYRYVLGLSFSTTLQIAIAFLSMMTLSFLLSRSFFEQWSRQEQNIAAAVIFSVGSTHPYWLDSNNFSTAVAPYPFAALLGVCAFLTALWLNKGALQTALCIVLGGVLFAAALSIYQPAALFGTIVGGALFTKSATVQRPRLIKLLLICVAIFALGILLYRMQMGVYFRLHPDSVPNPLLEAATFHLMLSKLANIFELYINSFVAIQFLAWSHAYYYASIAFLAWALAVLAVCVVRLRDVIGYSGCGRMIAGFIATAIVPILGGWVVIAPDFPIRSISLIAFPLVFLTLLIIHEAKAQSSVLAEITLVFCVALFACGFLITSVGWTKQQRAYERDLATAYAIVGAVSNLPVGTRISIVGDHSYTDLFPVATVGQSIFENYWAKVFIFKELFRVEFTIIPTSPVSCNAFPVPGSIILHAGEAYVCLQEFQGL